MWGNYLTVALRALTKSRTFAFINIFGLALGLAACLLLLLYVRYETSYDAGLPDAERVYQVQTTTIDKETGERRVQQAAPRPVTEALVKDFPQIEFASKAESDRPTILTNGRPEAAEALQVDEHFFRILSVPFLRGDPATVMQDANSLAMSRSEALKRFGTVDAVGRTITTLSPTGEKRDLKVTGVFEDMPRNSHLDLTLVSRFKEEWECGWTCTTGSTYLKLKPGADVEAINAALPEWEKRNIPSEDVGGVKVNPGSESDWRLVNVQDVHLSGAEGDRPGNDRTTIATFTIVAFLILFMAVVNFTNLATARASQRAREVALRKVLGASRRHLVSQFLGESLLITAVAMLVALAIVELTLPTFSAFLEADLDLHYLGEGGFLPQILGLTLLVALVGGLYPAFYLSRYRPASVLKANNSAAETSGSGRLRAMLVVAQFAVSIGLIICTITVYHQTLFASRMSAGFDRSGLIQIEGLLRPELQQQYETLTRQIAGINGVEAVSGTAILPAGDQTLFTNVQVPGKAVPEKIGWYSVEAGFFETMRIPLLAGRALSERFAKDNAKIDYGALPDQAALDAVQRSLAVRGVNIVVNEEGAKRLGLGSAQAAVGKQISLPLFGEGEAVVPATIVGVAANSRFRQLRQPIEPTIYYDMGQYRRLAIRYDSADPQAVLAGIERIWRQLAPAAPLEAEFTDEKMADLYEGDARRGQIFAGFALLAVVIACLGLFGLAAFTAERRTKEIGIRKVFGARVRDIVQLLAWQFSKPVIVANLIAWPVAWWVMRDWLNGFDARIALTPGPFLLAGLLALVIAIGTIAGHAIKVARLNPIHALRYE